MSTRDRLAWAALESEITGSPVPLPDGSTVTLEPVESVLTSREHAERVTAKHGLPANGLVLVQTFPDGTTRNHWNETKGAAA